MKLIATHSGIFLVVFLTNHWTFANLGGMWILQVFFSTKRIPKVEPTKSVGASEKPMLVFGSKKNTRWWFHILCVHPSLGKWSNLTNICHMGWNHRLEFFIVSFWQFRLENDFPKVDFEHSLDIQSYLVRIRCQRTWGSAFRGSKHLSVTRYDWRILDRDLMIFVQSCKFVGFWQ